MPALVSFINHFGPKIQRSISFFPSLRSYFSSSCCNWRSGGAIVTASSGTAGASVPGTDRKSSRQSWGNKIKAKSDYLELTGLSSNTVTITDDNERDGTVHIKDLESGLHRTQVPARDVDSGLQQSPLSVRRPDIESQSSSKHVEIELQWSPVSVKHPEIESQPSATGQKSDSPNKHVESWSPVAGRHPEIEPQLATTGQQPQSPSKHIVSPLRMHPPR